MPETNWVSEIPRPPFACLHTLLPQPDPSPLPRLGRRVEADTHSPSVLKSFGHQSEELRAATAPAPPDSQRPARRPIRQIAFNHFGAGHRSRCELLVSFVPMILPQKCDQSCAKFGHTSVSRSRHRPPQRRPFPDFNNFFAPGTGFGTRCPTQIPECGRPAPPPPTCATATGRLPVLPCGPVRSRAAPLVVFRRPAVLGLTACAMAARPRRAPGRVIAAGHPSAGVPRPGRQRPFGANDVGHQRPNKLGRKSVPTRPPRPERGARDILIELDPGAADPGRGIQPRPTARNRRRTVHYSRASVAPELGAVVPNPETRNGSFANCSPLSGASTKPITPPATSNRL